MAKYLFDQAKTKTDLVDFFKNLSGEFKRYIIKFYGIIYMNAIELDFDQRAVMESFIAVQESEKIKEFRKLDHSGKLKDNHQHYYFRTYDTVFEIVDEGFELTS